MRQAGSAMAATSAAGSSGATTMRRRQPTTRAVPPPPSRSIVLYNPSCGASRSRWSGRFRLTPVMPQAPGSAASTSSV